MKWLVQGIAILASLMSRWWSGRQWALSFAEMWKRWIIHYLQQTENPIIWLLYVFSPLAFNITFPTLNFLSHIYLALYTRYDILFDYICNNSSPPLTDIVRFGSLRITINLTVLKTLRRSPKRLQRRLSASGGFGLLQYSSFHRQTLLY